MTHDSIVALPEKEDSCGGALKRLMTEYKKSPAEIMKALCSQTVEIVLTAHPTEVNRRTIIDKHHRIKQILQQEERPDLVPYEIRQLNKQLKAEIAAIWESETVGDINNQRGRLVVLGSTEIFGDDWLDKEENSKLN
jgi:phosphoenolpyruvate carboxylase